MEDAEDGIEKAILGSQNLFKLFFRQTWNKHECDIDGCTKFPMSDGGMKIQRQV